MRAFLLLICLCALGTEVYPSSVFLETNGNFYNMFPLKVKELEVSVKTETDAIIVLTTEPFYAEVFYVICLGGWNNTKSRIQKGLVSPEGDRDFIAPIFEGDVFQTFTVIFDDQEGSITVKKGVKDVILYFKDPYYTKMSYFGVSTPGLGHWDINFDMFDCECCYKN